MLAETLMHADGYERGECQEEELDCWIVSCCADMIILGFRTKAKMVRTSSAPNSRIILSRVHIFRPTTIVEIPVNSQIMMSILGPLLVSPSGGGTMDGCCKDPMMATWKMNDM